MRDIAFLRSMGHSSQTILEPQPARLRDITVLLGQPVDLSID